MQAPWLSSPHCSFFPLSPMAWLYEHSPAWRRLVAWSRRSSLHTAGFAVAALGSSVALGALAMAASSRDAPGGDLDARLRARRAASVDGRLLADANRARLAVLLDDVRNKGQDAEDRYGAALRGASLGTHAGGTTKGVGVGEEGRRGRR